MDTSGESKSKRKREGRTADGSGGAEAIDDAVALAKRARLEQPDQQHVREEAAPTVEATAKKERDHREVVYMGSTRAVIGPGFVVRELLFGSEVVSVRLSKQTAFLDRASTLEILPQSMVHSVEHIDIGRASGAASATSVNVHLASKHMVEPFIQSCNASGDSPHGLRIEGRGLHPAQAPTVFRPTELSGLLEVTWANGEATGKATLRFASAPAANAFLRWAVSKKVPELLKSIRVRPSGYTAEIGRANDPEKAWLPPLKVGGDGVCVFAEEKIELMPGAEVDGFRYVAEITSGLPRDVDETELRELVQPHKCNVCILRVADPSVIQPDAERSEMLRRLTAPLTSHLAEGEYIQWSEDEEAQRTRVHVDFNDFSRLEEMRRKVSKSPLWSSAGKPFGQAIRVEVVYELRILMALDAYKCFQERLNKVRADAKSADVQWSEAPAADDANRVMIVLQSLSPGAVGRIDKAIRCCVECEALSDSALHSPSMSVSAWKKYVHELTDKARLAGMCVRGSHATRDIWVYGDANARREAIYGMKMTLLPQATAVDNIHCSECSVQVKSAHLKLTTCGHILCLSCAQTAIASYLFPIRCPADNCMEKIHVNDIFKVAKDMTELVRMAVFDYVEDHPDDCAICPRPGCNQVFARSTSGTNQFADCESCGGEYSSDYSRYTGQAVQAHVGIDCAGHLFGGPH